jgi:Lysyl oxidase
MPRRRIARLAVVSLILSMLAGATTTADATTTPTVFLPDVRPLPPSDLSIAVSNGHTLLYFSFSPEDIGTGPMELQPKAEDCNGDGNFNNDRTAYQNVYGDTNGNGVYDWPNSPTPPGPDDIVSSTPVGCFTFDSAHGHWHFANYGKYRLLTLTGKVKASRTKVGFCMIDDSQVDPLPGSPPAAYYVGCDDGEIQGISVGWDDVYPWYIAGQSLRIDHVADGRYCLVETADPKHQLQEPDTTNNQSRLKIRIQGTHVEALSHPC